MRILKIILFAILVVFIVIQFIQPAHNENGQVLQTDISNYYHIPDNVQALLKNACYDCHSNNTVYPWYAYIQPVAWLLEQDIKKGKEKLNFNEFSSYSRRRRTSKLKNIEDRIKDGTMPLRSYNWMHKNSRLTKEHKTLLIDWIEKTIDNSQSR